MIEAYKKGLELLSRREHSTEELRLKLKQRRYPVDEIESALQMFIEQRIISDERFAESYAYHRQQAGFGPMRIRLELAQKGISKALSAQILENMDVDWIALSERVRQKKFGCLQPHTKTEEIKQTRFLQYRGFDPELSLARKICE